MELATQNNQSVSTQINEGFVKQLYHVNYLVNYPISDFMLEGWSKSIQELAPEITIEDLKIITDRMKLGSIEFDHRKGIQNIFNGYKTIINEKIQIKTNERNKLGNHYDYSEEQKLKDDKISNDIKELRGILSKFTVNTPMQMIY